MRFLELFGWRPKPSVPAVLAAVPPKPPTSAEAFRRCLAQVPNLAPREASMGAFVAWLRVHGEHGDWEQSELLEQYEIICELTRVEAMPAKWFGKALEKQGCRRWQASLVVDGERWRPMMVHVPAASPVKQESETKTPNGNEEGVPWPELPKRARAGTYAQA